MAVIAAVFGRDESPSGVCSGSVHIDGLKFDKMTFVPQSTTTYPVLMGCECNHKYSLKITEKVGGYLLPSPYSARVPIFSAARGRYRRRTALPLTLSQTFLAAETGPAGPRDVITGNFSWEEFPASDRIRSVSESKPDGCADDGRKE